MTGITGLDEFFKFSNDENNKPFMLDWTNKLIILEDEERYVFDALLDFTVVIKVKKDESALRISVRFKNQIPQDGARIAGITK